MAATLTAFGIRAILRLKQAGQEALEQSARDQKAVFPELIKPNVGRLQIVRTVFRSPEFENRVAQGTEHAALWQHVRNEAAPTAAAIDTLYVFAAQLYADEGLELGRTASSNQTAAGAVLVGQWSEEGKPLSPVARVLLTAADVALEYVASNPTILDVGGSGEELLGAFAENLSELLPDDGAFGPREHLAERLGTTFLRAGLETLSEHTDLVTSKDHVGKLVSATVEPVLAVLPDSLAERLEFEAVLDALMGPAAGAAMKTIAEKPDAFLGNDFAASHALGALTQGVLRGAAADGLVQQLGKEGLLEIYRAALGVAAEQPDLFVNGDGSPKDDLVKALFGNLAATLASSPAPFAGGEGAKLASVVLETVSANVHRFTVDGEPLEKMTADLVKTFSGQLAEALTRNGRLGSVLTRPRRIELARVALTHIAATPAIIVDSRATLGSVIGAVAVAMAEDEKLLLGGDDWVEIVRVAAAEAASNPGRLFGAADSPADEPAAQLLGLLIRSAGEIVASPDSRSVLFGKTLRDAATILIKASSGNVAAVREHIGKIEAAVEALNDLVAAHAEHFGNKEWLRLFRVLVMRALDGKDTPALTVETAVALMEGIAA